MHACCMRRSHICSSSCVKACSCRAAFDLYFKLYKRAFATEVCYSCTATLFYYTRQVVCILYAMHPAIHDRIMQSHRCRVHSVQNTNNLPCVVEQSGSIINYTCDQGNWHQHCVQQLMWAPQQAVGRASEALCSTVCMACHKQDHAVG